MGIDKTHIFFFFLFFSFFFLSFPPSVFENTFFFLCIQTEREKKPHKLFWSTFCFQFHYLINHKIHLISITALLIKHRQRSFPTRKISWVKWAGYFNSVPNWPVSSTETPLHWLTFHKGTQKKWTSTGNNYPPSPGIDYIGRVHRKVCKTVTAAAPAVLLYIPAKVGWHFQQEPTEKMTFGYSDSCYICQSREYNFFNRI